MKRTKRNKAKRKQKSITKKPTTKFDSTNLGVCSTVPDSKHWLTTSFLLFAGRCQTAMLGPWYRATQAELKPWKLLLRR